MKFPIQFRPDEVAHEITEMENKLSAGLTALTSMKDEDVDIGSTPKDVFYARETCNDSSSELSCKAADLAKPNETTRELTFPVLPGVPVFLFVDGIGAGSGPATLSLTVTP